MKLFIQEMRINELIKTATGCFFLRIMLSLLFTFYAVLPISYVYASGNTVDDIYNQDITLLLPQIAIVHFRCLTYTQPDLNEDASQKNSTIKILIKKKRAVMPKNVLQQINNFVIAFPSKGLYLHNDCSSAWCLAGHKPNKALKGNRCLHSGLSPPLI